MQRARELRVHPTEAEAALWEHLRRRQVGGWKFRRQHLIAGFIVDFFCPELSLVIELDGDVHDDREREDALRSHYLAQFDVHVVRVSNLAVLGAPAALVQRLTVLCQETAQRRRHLSPFPRNRGKGVGG